MKNPIIMWHPLHYRHRRRALYSKVSQTICRHQIVWKSYGTNIPKPTFGSAI